MMRLESMEQGGKHNLLTSRGKQMYALKKKLKQKERKGEQGKRKYKEITCRKSRNLPTR